MAYIPKYISPIKISIKTYLTVVILFFATASAILFHSVSNKTEFKLQRAIRENDLTKIQKIISDNKSYVNTKFDSSSPLAVAVTEENLEISKFLIQNGASVNSKVGRHHGSILSIAVKRNDEKSADLLIRHGADVNSEDIFGKTPLIDAAINCNQKLIEILIKHGADVNHRDRKTNYSKEPERTALEYANEQGCSNDIFNLLEP